MKPSRSLTRSLCRVLRVCSFALLAAGLLAPVAAQAAHCGQYALAQARYEADLTRLISGESSADIGILPGIPLPPAAPCKGAFCSAPPAAPAAPLAPVTAPGEHWLCPVAKVEIAGASSFLLETADEASRPVHTGCSIFHPPRHLVPSA